MKASRTEKIPETRQRNHESRQQPHRLDTAMGNGEARVNDFYRLKLRDEIETSFLCVMAKLSFHEIYTVDIV